MHMKTMTADLAPPAQASVANRWRPTDVVETIASVCALVAIWCVWRVAKIKHGESDLQ